MTAQEIAVQMTLKAWNIQMSRTDKFFNEKSDEDLEREIAPGKNRLVYLMGHLIAANDSMIALFGVGERQYAHYDEAFLKNADKSGLQMPTINELRTAWKNAYEELNRLFASMSAEDWFRRHTAMTDDDFVKEPGRNKLSVLVNRTNHVAYHLGQLVLVK